MPEPNTPSYLTLMQRVARREAESMRVCTIAAVEAYDDDTRSCRVRPLLPVRRPDGTLVDLPVIHRVPVKTMRFGGYVIAAPLSAGDIVELTFADRSLDAWLSQGGTETLDPRDVRAHSLSDAMAGPGPDPNNGTAFTTGGDLVIGREDGSMQIRITAAGKVSIGNDGAELLDLVSQLASAVATGVTTIPSGGGTAPLSTAGVGTSVKAAIDAMKG